MALGRDDLFLLYLLEEEEECVLLTRKMNRAKPHELYSTREHEGFQNILIKRHLMNDQSLFRKFFRLNIAQFNFILSIIKDDISSQSCGRVKVPISPDEKLGVTLR